jgi:hypothetical protein
VAQVLLSCPLKVQSLTCKEDDSVYPLSKPNISTATKKTVLVPLPRSSWHPFQEFSIQNPYFQTMHSRLIFKRYTQVYIYIYNIFIYVFIHNYRILMDCCPSPEARRGKRTMNRTRFGQEYASRVCRSSNLGGGGGDSGTWTSFLSGLPQGGTTATSADKSEQGETAK